MVEKALAHFGQRGLDWNPYIECWFVYLQMEIIKLVSKVCCCEVREEVTAEE